MKIKILIWSIFMLTLLSCGASKNPPTDAEMAALNELINQRHFKIESDWAYPQATMAMQRVLNSGILPPGDNASSINLVGNYNFLKIDGDSISSHLPYFGERQMQIAYGGTDTAIEFKGLVDNYKVEKNKKYGYNVSFNASSNQESFSVFITISPSLKTDMVLNGTGRFPIRYSGVAIPSKEIEEE
ncbi:DUF4251 domain-containing protein [Flavisericum labens]|uniref:DUF4251 domain-containing protein n=1 Tax=Flavisericum labens TaxID=3377112 RepID=UPI00387AFDC4